MINCFSNLLIAFTPGVIKNKQKNVICICGFTTPSNIYYETFLQNYHLIALAAN